MDRNLGAHELAPFDIDRILAKAQDHSVDQLAVTARDSKLNILRPHPRRSVARNALSSASQGYLNVKSRFPERLDQRQGSCSQHPRPARLSIKEPQTCH